MFFLIKCVFKDKNNEDLWQDVVFLNFLYNEGLVLGPAHTGWIKPKHLIFKNHHYGSFLGPSTPHNFSSRIDHPSQHLAITAKFVVTIRRSCSYRPTLWNLAIWPDIHSLNVRFPPPKTPNILRCPHPCFNICLKILCGVPTPSRTSDQIHLICMYDVPPPYIWNLLTLQLTDYLNFPFNFVSIPNPVSRFDQTPHLEY